MRTLTTPRMEQDTKTSAEPELRLVLPSEAENVALVRRALSGVVDVLELGEARLLDINAAVSEACNNVVVHAYEGTEGPMDVYLWIQPTELEVIVSDQGVGIRPNVPEPSLEVQGLGLSLIQALTDRVEFLGGMGEGTRVRMRFALDGAPEALHNGDRGDGLDAPPPPGELSIAVSSGPLAAPVLGRVIAMLAARAEFSLEGISEAELVTDAVAAHAPRAIVGNRIQLGIDRPDGRLVVRVGPLAEGGATRVIQSSALDDLPPVLERLTEQRRVESSGDGELLCLVLGAR
jgi:serine/threonine-protein kinase RsbW